MFGVLDISKYLTFKATWKKLLGSDEDFGTSSYSEGIEIPCFIYGKDLFIRGENSASVVTAKTYLCTAPVNPKDLIDGQVVKAVYSYPQNWTSDGQLYEVVTWDN